jgi:hypothetical protein
MGVMEIEFHPDNMYLEVVFSLSKSWKPLLQTLKHYKKGHFSKEK